MKRKSVFRQPSLWLLVAAISLFLLIIALYGFRLSWLSRPEASLVRSSTGIKQYLNKHILKGRIYENDFFQQRFLLVNTAYDVALARNAARDGGAGMRSAITDRRKLARLFNWLARHDTAYDMVVCDIQFSDPADDTGSDSLLQQSLINLFRQPPGKVFFACDFDEQKAVFPSYFPEISNHPQYLGDTRYEGFHNGYFLDYILARNGGRLKSIPLLMYQAAHRAEVQDGRFLSLGSEDGPMGLLRLQDSNKVTHRVWNRFTPEMLFGEKELQELETFEQSDGSKGQPAMIRLGTAVEDEDADGEQPNLSWLTAQNKHRIIFIGAFGASHIDKHETLFGQVDGSLILLNIYRELETNTNQFSAWFILFLFLIFTVLATDIVFNGFLHHYFYRVIDILFLFFIVRLLLDAFGKISAKWKKAGEDWKKWVEHQSHYFILVFTTLVANLFFNRIINFIIIFLVVMALHKLFRYIWGRKKIA